jgi:phage terminase small subunit
MKIGRPTKKQQKQILEIKKKFIDAYRKQFTVVGAAREVGIAPKTAFEWLEKDQELAKEIRDAEKELLDYTKSKLLIAIREGNLTAIIFFLKTRHPEFRTTDNQVNVISQQNVNNMLNIDPKVAKEILDVLEKDFEKNNNG